MRVYSETPLIRGNSNHLQSRARSIHKHCNAFVVSTLCVETLYGVPLTLQRGKEKVQCERNTLQELIIVAIIAQEKSWLEYMEKGYDIHSKNSELIFGDEWVNATEEGCEYYSYGSDEPAYKKCRCKGHMEMRDNSKAVSFGSIYGISFIKLAFNLKISEDRAKFILKRFFEICPAIADMMVRFGNYAIHNGHIIEPVFGRVRFFDKWKLAVPQEHSAIERAAFNTPIQSSGSACLKIAFVLMRRWLNHEDLNRHVQLLLPYHDRVLSCINSFNCGKLSKVISTGKDIFLSLHDQCNGWSSNNLITRRQSAAI